MDSTNNNSTAKVQCVTKKSSDELLRKFAELGDDEDKVKKEIRVPKRRKRSRMPRRDDGDVVIQVDESPLNANSLVERRSLLPPVTRKSLLLRQLGIGRSQFKAREIRNKSIIGAIEKTWRRTLEGASKVLLEKHYNRHRRLINDMV